MIVTEDGLTFHTPRGFLVIDGVNGAGKSTLLERISALLTERGRQVVRTREPGATPIGKELRALLLNPREDKISPLAELLMFAADRAEHVEKVIRPALAEGKLVVCDRYHYSTTAFQGYGRGLNLNTIRELNTLATEGLAPDFFLLLDLAPEIGLARTMGRSEEDMFEAEELAFHQRLRAGFLDVASSVEEPVVIIDAAPSTEVVWNRVRKLVERWIRALPQCFQWAIPLVVGTSHFCVMYPPSGKKDLISSILVFL